ncbi:MAG: methyltransferase domain-containing protein [Firmicutes bacterium]|nr:methyltransferase domain-containing protein [Bacillota bacterium]
MNEFWSENVQGVMTLYLSRRLRFHDRFFERYRKPFGLDGTRELGILEIGCGPGALAGSLHRWYPKARITGIDRDSRFIAFARENVPGVEFVEGDAARLPFGDAEFDVTVSYTVQEHIEPAVFWGEQLRVLKPGGICLCLSARKALRCTAPCLEITEIEKEFWDSVPQADSWLERNGVGAYRLSEAELPAAMERYGFSDVTADYALIHLTPDAKDTPQEMAEAMIEAARQSDLEAIRSARSAGGERAASAVNARYDERLRLLRAGIKQWDTELSVTMIVRGRK